MNNPATNILQGENISLNKSRNDEEEEDLEDQKRRNEEIQNLLMTKLDDFNYDESTVNSSLISGISIDDTQSKYLQADDANEQLKVLYEVRGRELISLREEYKNSTANMTKDIDAMKKKLMLSEAELEQLKVSYKNSEELLIEKTQIINELNSVLERKDKQISEYTKKMEDMEIEIATYKSTVNDLHFQLKGDQNPFNIANKQFNSEELSNAHRQQIIRLENLLEEKSVQYKLTSKENQTLKQQLNKILEANTDDAKLIKTLTKNFEEAQKQCEELIDVIEALSNENKHLQERVNNTYNTPPINKKNQAELAYHVEKLKKMLVDKSVQIDTLKSKLQNYEGNVKELLEYRQLKNYAYQKEFQQCENEEHTKNLIIMQNDLQNYRRIIEDKNQQILNLNSTNKDLLAKMEETLSQTRNDIQTFSTKYSLPQLTKMAEDLKAAQNHILYLEEKLKITEEPNLEKESNLLKSELDKERNNFENKTRKLEKELDTLSAELNNLKHYNEQLITENTKLKLKINNNEKDDKNSTELMESFYKSQQEIKQLNDTIIEITNLKTIIEGEKCTLQDEIKQFQNKLGTANDYIKEIETKLHTVTKDLQDKNKIIQELQETILNLQKINGHNTSKDLQQKNKIIQELHETIKNLQKDGHNISKELEDKNKIIQELEETVTNLKENLQKSSITSKDLEEKNKIIQDLQDNITNLEEKCYCKNDKLIKRNLVSELDKDEMEEENIITKDIKLRAEMQEEFSKKLKDIEIKYQKACGVPISKCKDCTESAQKLSTQDTKFREYLSVILTECSQKIKDLENEKEEMNKNVQNQLHEYHNSIKMREQLYRNLIKELQEKNKNDHEMWNQWSKTFVNKILKIKAANIKSSDSFTNKMQKYDEEVEKIIKTVDKVKKKLEKKVSRTK